MNAERMDRVSQLLHAALEREPEERRGFLDEVCAGDDALRREIESLLSAHDQAESFMETPPLDLASELLAAERAEALIGRSLGPFRIHSLLGRGGMGEVYRATDVRLGRPVAIKILSPQLSRNAEFRRRLELEARAISRLNHPNICALYDVGRQDGVDYLVMEYIEGQTLEERLQRGALPLNEALRYACEIAAALQAAHREGITHRDIKPANIILLREGCKVLDFGLAKLVPSEASGSFLYTAGSADGNPTLKGTILGTLPYMAPEQLEGHDADSRVDIFALGAVLYEMVTGRKAFEGRSQASVIAAIMTTDPAPMENFQPLLPRALDHVVRRCLARDPEERWQTALDLKKELQWIAASPDSSIATSTARSSRRAWLLASVGGVVALAEGVLLLRRKPAAPASAAPSLHRFFAPQGTVLGPKPLFGGPAVSPDGSGIVFAAVRGGESQLYLQLRTATESQPLPGTEDGCNPFWSPDNRRIGFFARGKLKITSISGGVAQEVCDVSTAFDNQGKGGTWNRDDVIVFATARLDALKKVSLRSGVPEPATVLANDESMHRWPCFLPDGQHFLYLSLQRGRTSSTWLGSLNPDEKKTLVLPNHNSSVIYAAGALLYVKGETLMAQPFDPAGHKIRGEAVRLAAIAPAPVTNSALFSASETGRLVYYGNDVTRVVLRDRSGREAWSSGDGRYVSIRLSPDGHRVAYELMFFADRFADSEKLWLLDLKTGQQTPYKGAASMVPRSTLFSSDGNQLIFSSGGNIYRTSLAEDKPEPLMQNKSIGFYPNDISREGFLLLQGNVRNNSDPARLWYARVTPQLALAQEPQPYTETFGQEARFSPDGRWVAYTSGDSGHQQIWIREFPSGRHKTLVSEQGGRFPAWGKAGREIVYLSDNYSLTAVPLQLGANSVLRPSGRATELFTVPAGLPGGEEGRSPWWDMTPDGETFYILEVRPTPIYVLDNWTTS